MPRAAFTSEEFTPAERAEGRKLYAAYLTREAEPPTEEDPEFSELEIDEGRLRAGMSGRGEIIPTTRVRLPGQEEKEHSTAIVDSDPYLTQHVLGPGRGLYRKPKFAESVGEELSGIYEATKSKLSLGFAGEEPQTGTQDVMSEILTAGAGAGTALIGLGLAKLSRVAGIVKSKILKEGFTFLKTGEEQLSKLPSRPEIQERAAELLAEQAYKARTGVNTDWNLVTKLLGDKATVTPIHVQSYIKNTLPKLGEAIKPDELITKLMNKFVALPSVKNARALEESINLQLPPNKAIWTGYHNTLLTLKRAVQTGLSDAKVRGNLEARVLGTVVDRYKHYAQVFKDNNLVRKIALQKDQKTIDGMVDKISRGKWSMADLKAMKRALWEKGGTQGKTAWKNVSRSMISEKLNKVFTNPAYSDISSNFNTQVEAAKAMVREFNTLGLDKIKAAMSPRDFQIVQKWYNGARSVARAKDPGAAARTFERMFPTETIAGQTVRMSIKYTGRGLLMAGGGIIAAKLLGADEWFQGGGGGGGRGR